MDDQFAELQLPESRVLIIITGNKPLPTYRVSCISNTRQVAQYVCASLQTVLCLLEDF